VGKIRPRIGITCDFNQVEKHCYLRQAYISSVVAAGGLPILLPAGLEAAVVNDYLDSIDGLILSGGGDIEPDYFGELPHPALGEICPERDEFELDLVRLALKRGIPILGICRGIQVLNVAAGGDLYQDLINERPGLIMHQQKAPRDYPIHPIKVVSGSRLAQLLNLDSEGELHQDGQSGFDAGSGSISSSPITIRVNSRHHQAIRKLAPGFVVSAYSPDDLIEAIESSQGNLVIGVQCHPEDLWRKDTRFLGLFKGLVEAARGKRKG